MKQIIQYQQKIKPETLKIINDSIKELKKEFNKRKYNHIGQLYELLDKIVKLRQKTISRYTERSLELEEGIELKASEIRYIFAYQYLSSYAREKVLQGLIDDTTVCHFLAVSSLLRSPEWQNKLIDKIISDKIRISQISELTLEEIKLFLQDKLELRTDDKYFLSVTKSLRSMKNRIEERKHLINDSPYKDNLINAIKELNKLVIKK